MVFVLVQFKIHILVYSQENTNLNNIEPTEPVITSVLWEVTNTFNLNQYGTCADMSLRSHKDLFFKKIKKVLKTPNLNISLSREVFSVSVVCWLQGQLQLAPPLCWHWYSQRQPSGDHWTGLLEQVDQPTPLSVDGVWWHRFRMPINRLMVEHVHAWGNTYTHSNLGNLEAGGNRCLEDLRRWDFRVTQGGEVSSEVVVVGQTVGSISSKTLAYDCLCTLELCTASMIVTS